MFVPVSFMGGIAGQYFKQFGLVVAFAVLFSLLVARLITPLLAAYFMRASRHEDKEGWLLRGLHPPGALVGARITTSRWRSGLLIFAGSIGSFYLLPSGFLPAEDTEPHCCWPSSCRPARAWPRRAPSPTRIARQIRERPEVQSVFVNGGRVLGSGAEVRKATLVINLVPKEKRKLTPGPGARRDRRAASPACPTSASGS